jgi:hypothetical protein
MYGAADGFIPNYANTGPGTMTRAAGTSSGVPSSAAPVATPVAAPVAASRDFLGTLFAVQLGLSALEGATSGATSTIGKAVGILSGGINSIVQIAFVLSGLKMALAGATTGVLLFASKALAKTTPFIIGLAAASIAVKTLASFIVPASKKSAESLERMALIADKLTSSLSEVQKYEIKKTISKTTGLKEPA